jgi:hypothetical protein
MGIDTAGSPPIIGVYAERIQSREFPWKDEDTDDLGGMERKVPEISRFYGMVIAMYYSEHNPPHFHARYGKHKAAIEIRTLRVLEGTLPPRAMGLVMEWASQHEDELLADWEEARNDRPPRRIDPL